MTGTVDRRELNAQMAKKVEFAYAALKAATDFANEHGLQFDFGPEYGMGGTYYGGTNDFNEPEPEPRFSSEWYEWDDRRDASERGWRSSSSQC